MPVLEFEITLGAPLDVVWAFHDGVANLAVLSPPDAEVKIESADTPVKVGSRIVITAKGPLGRLRWVARIVEHKPPRALVFGEEARFVDEQESGPFKAWRHEHDFERGDEKSTRLLDRVTYRVGWGPIGWLADVLIVRRRLRSMFRHRHAVLRERFAVAAEASA
jgi:ligand-binding SRPBCC domain-containing protein